MELLGRRPRRRRVHGPAGGTRAARHGSTAARALAAVAISATVTLCTVSAAYANAANPIAPAELNAGSVVQNANGTVTVTATGTWIWPFGVESDTTQGIHATVQHPCDHRTGVGWGVVWNDVSDPGYTETYRTKAGVVLTQTVHVGSQGVNPLNVDHEVQYNATDPCGHFVQTNVPAQGDGYDTGTWSSTHVYANLADVPKSVCVITFDLGLAHPPGKHRISFANNDNSVQWGLFSSGYWNTTTMGKNCSATPAAVAASSQPVVTVSQTTPTTPVVSKPSTSLAFTGFGRPGLTTAFIGAVLLGLGVLIYLGDRLIGLRRRGRWSSGR